MKMKLFSVFAAWSATFIATAQAPTGPAVKSAPPPTTSLAAPVAAAKASAAALSDQAKATDATLATPKVAEAPAPKVAEAPVPKVAEAPVPKAAAPAVPAVAANPVGQTDEVDLEEIDDAALADKQPSVKKAEGVKESAGADKSDAQPLPADEALEDATYARDESALVDITCEDATLADILRQFRKAIGANIISGDSSNLQQRVSVNLRHVPWFQSLQSILNTRNFRLEDRSGIYFVSEDKRAVPEFTRTYTLNHAGADELAKLFNESYGTKEKPVASAFPAANVIVVTATEKVLADCENIIKSVDRAVAQIYIEARFIELSTESMHKLGLQWNQLESWGASARNIAGGIEFNDGRVADYGAKLAKHTIMKTVQDDGSQTRTSADSTGLSSADVTGAKVSRNNTDSQEFTGFVPEKLTGATGANRSADSMGWRNARGFQGQLSLDDFRLAMSAFESMTDAKVFSNPKIIVANGKEAKVDMTKKYPNIKVSSDFTGQNQNSLSVSTSLEVIPGEDKFMFAKEAFFSWGITLSVKPRISPDGLISVEIVPTISACDEFAAVQSNKDSDTPYSRYPVIDVQRLTTEFTMKDGATAVIGGLSQTKEEDIDSGIPYLRKIPWIGQKLFGWKSRGKVQKEIIVFVTVGIANPAELPKDIGLPKNAVLGREYVEGRRFEPGDRTNGVDGVTGIDTRTLDEMRAAEKKAQEAKNAASASRAANPGSVIVVPVEKTREPRRPAPAVPAKKPEAAPADGAKDSSPVVVTLVG
ncbi:MAG: hypothetical protein MJ240_12500 [Kiritimatiellae bacterium]|nr:hypothetical protein [Kiritimatiellia bacterium]